MIYKCRPGIIRVKVCGENLLVPLRAASEQCPNVMRLSLMGAMVWEDIAKGNDGTSVVPILQRLTRRPEAAVRGRVEETVKGLYEKGFLIEGA